MIGQTPETDRTRNTTIRKTVDFLNLYIISQVGGMGKVKASPQGQFTQVAHDALQAKWSMIGQTPETNRIRNTTIRKTVVFLNIV